MLAESASAAMLVVLETLALVEREVFVLREVFGFPHEDIAGTVGRSTADVRQLAHRAREHVRARRPRFSADGQTQRQVTRRFMEACRGGDLDALLAQLSPGVTLWTDGGGKVRSARNPIRGARKVARFLAAIHPVRFARQEFRFVRLNGQPGALLYRGGVLEAAMTVHVVEGHVEWLGIVANPDKLAVLPGVSAHGAQERG